MHLTIDASDLTQQDATVLGRQGTEGSEPCPGVHELRLYDVARPRQYGSAVPDCGSAQRAKRWPGERPAARRRGGARQQLVGGHTATCAASTVPAGICRSRASRTAPPPITVITSRQTGPSGKALHRKTATSWRADRPRNVPTLHQTSPPPLAVRIIHCTRVARCSIRAVGLAPRLAIRCGGAGGPPRQPCSVELAGDVQIRRLDKEEKACPTPFLPM